MMREDYNKSTKRLSILNEESSRVKNLEHVGQHDIQYLEQYYHTLELDENQMLGKIRNEYSDNLVYKHVRERLRQTLMHLELQNQYLQDQIRLKNFLIDSEHRKKIKSLENKFTMVQAFKHTSQSVNLDVKDRTQDLNILEDDIKVRQKIHELRKTRMKKYEEIAEAAAIEEGDLKSNSVREALLLNIVWSKYLTAKFERERAKNVRIEAAYKNIKAATTVHDPKEMVQRFLMKEERFSTLMISLTESRSVCEKYRFKNENLEKKIDDYILTQKEGKNFNNFKASIHKTNGKIIDAKDKLKEITIAFEKIRSWACKNIKSIKPDWEYENESLQELYVILQKVLMARIPKGSPFITDL